MAKEITSNDWHVRGVSVEVRQLVNSYCGLNDLQQGDAVDYLLRNSPELKALAGLLKPLKTTK